jgi:hypothetical protein
MPAIFLGERCKEPLQGLSVKQKITEQKLRMKEEGMFSTHIEYLRRLHSLFTHLRHFRQKSQRPLSIPELERSIDHSRHTVLAKPSWVQLRIN